MADRIEFNIPDNLRNAKGSFSSFIGVAIVVLVIWGAVSSYYTVQAESQGVVLRFGRYYTAVDPGLHFKLPFGIDSVLIVPVERQLKQEFGFGTAGATNRSQFAVTSAEREQERGMVTGDLNAATVEWIVQYKIKDPKLYLFKVRDPEETLRGLSESVMRAVVGDRTVDEVITVGRQGIASEALVAMQALVDKYELGLSIDQVQLKDVNPPPPVQDSFNDVNRAEQEREEMINIAKGEYNKVIPRARGEAEQKIQSAEGYRSKRVNEAEGEVARFNDLLGEYLKAPGVMRRRLYWETMEAVMPNTGKKIIIDSEAQQILPFLQLGGEAK